MRKSDELEVELAFSLEERQKRRKKLHPEEIKNVCAMSMYDRYAYFVKRICFNEEVWALFDDAGLQSFLFNEKWCIPFWSHDEIGSTVLHVEHLSENLRNPKFVPIPIDDWINEILWEDMRPDNVHLFIQPVPNNDSRIVSVDDFLEDFVAEYAYFLIDFEGFDENDSEGTRQKWLHHSVVKAMQNNPKGKLP